MKTINGPYGSYKSGSVGAVLNSLCRVYGYPTCTIDNLTIGDGKIYTGTQLFGMFEWLEDGSLLFVRREGAK